tara:strand:- start:952 stop:2274 length:1323 start_codon:yes stop_codon:yes gene_type:complete
MFNDGDSPHLHKTYSGAGNRDTFTFSTWVKRGTLGIEQRIFSSANTSGTNAYGALQFHPTYDDLIMFHYDGSSNYSYHRTNRQFKDPSAWLHICIAVDTTQSTASNRVKIYINGSQETSFRTETTPDQNTDMQWNTAEKHWVGAGDDDSGGQSRFFDGYLAETVFIDGLQLAPTSFGEFDSDSPNIWKPIDVSGLTFGTNGFYLDYEDSSSLGNDKAGSNNFTSSGLAATDQMIDTCTNNFCVMNPLTGSASGYAMAYSQGNLHVDGDQSWSNSMGTFGVTAGKWYWEIENFTYEHTQVGIASPDIDWGSAGVQDLTGTTLYYNSAGGEVRKDGSMTTADYGTFGTNDVLGIALNMDDGQITFYKNGSAIVSNYAISTSITTAVPLIAISGDYTIDINFGSPAIAITSGNADANGYGSFEYSVPSGYYSLCTQNLAKYGG